MSFATKILKFSPLGRISLFSYTKNERYINHFVALVTMVVIFCLIVDIALEISNPILKPSNCFFFMSLLICSNFADMKKEAFFIYSYQYVVPDGMCPRQAEKYEYSEVK